MLRYLTAFLGARLLGYLLFAAVAWELGALVSLPPGPRVVVMGAVHLLARMRADLVRILGRALRPSCAASELVNIGETKKRGVPERRRWAY